MAAPRVIILDFDGVVIESNDAKTRAFRRVFARFPEHAGAMMAFHDANIPLGRFHKFDHLLELLGRTGDIGLRDEIAADFTRLVQEEMQSVPLVAGVESFFEKITPRLPVYLASVTPAAELESIMDRRGLRAWFRGVYGCPPWTKPDAIRDVIARERLSPADALLIGDSSGDQNAAEETGVGFLARDSGLAFKPPAPLSFHDMGEITRYLEVLLT